MRPDEKKVLDQEVERKQQEMEEMMAKHPKVVTMGGQNFVQMTDPRTGLKMTRLERKGYWPDEV